MTLHRSHLLVAIVVELLLVHHSLARIPTTIIIILLLLLDYQNILSIRWRRLCPIRLLQLCQLLLAEDDVLLELLLLLMWRRLSLTLHRHLLSLSLRSSWGLLELLLWLHRHLSANAAAHCTGIWRYSSRVRHRWIRERFNDLLDISTRIHDLRYRRLLLWLTTLLADNLSSRVRLHDHGLLRTRIIILDELNLLRVHDLWLRDGRQGGARGSQDHFGAIARYLSHRLLCDLELRLRDLLHIDHSSLGDRH